MNIVKNIIVVVICYKHGSNELLPALVLLFNNIIANGEYPSSWATGIIHPVHKKAAHNVPDNYRKVTVMPCIGKLFESVLNNRLSFKNDVCYDNDPFQAGFRSNSRTTDNIFILCTIIDKQRCLSNPCIHVLLILQKHLTILTDQHCTINY